MKSVLVRFQEYEEKASNAEKPVVKFILEHAKAASECSIHQLAEVTFSSSSTIIRLCKKTGFAGYKEFQKALIAEIVIREESTRAKNADIQKEDKLEELITKVTYKNIVSLEKTRKLLDESVLERCVDVLEQCRNIVFFGIGSSLLVAQDAYMKFLRIDKMCFIHDDWHVQLLHAKNMTSKDVAVIISYSGLTEEMIRCAETAKKRGAIVIAITRFADSKLAREADYKLYVAASEVLIRSGAMASRISQLNVVDILYTAYLNRHFEENAMQVKKTAIPKNREEDSI